MEQKPFDTEKYMMQYCINRLEEELEASNLEQILELKELMFKIICENHLLSDFKHPVQRLWSAILFRKNMLERDEALTLRPAEG